MSTIRKITLKSNDGESFEVEEAVALESQTIKYVIEDDCADDGIPLPNVDSKTLAIVLEYCKKRVELNEFAKVNQAKLIGLMLAADYLEIKDLLDLTGDTVADMIKGKTPEEVRETFNIKNEFNPEEKEEIRKAFNIENEFNPEEKKDQLEFLVRFFSGRQ